MSGDKMIAVVKKSEEYKDKTQKIVVIINAPIIVQRSPTCNIQWKRSTYSIFGDTWDSFSQMDHERFALHRIDEDTITLNVRIDKLFICPVYIEAFATIETIARNSAKLI